METKDIERKYRDAIAHTVPDVLDGILDGCKEQKGDIIMMNDKKKSKKWMASLSAAAAVAVLVFGGVGISRYQSNQIVDSIVGLDVNPSIQMEVNKSDKVLSVDARNEDAKAILEGMDLENIDLDVAVNAIIGSMLKNGYINELANSVLISVDNDDTAKAEELEKKLTDEINKLLSSNAINGAILSQMVTNDDNLSKLAEEYDISLGKASLIQKIIHANPQKTFEELAKLSIHELNLLASSSRVDAKDIQTSGTASDKAYIGSDKAISIALSHASVGVTAAKNVEAEIDFENGVIVYEVEFTAGDKEYDYEIDAMSGEVIKFFSEAVEVEDEKDDKDDLDEKDDDDDKDDLDEKDDDGDKDDLNDKDDDDDKDDLDDKDDDDDKDDLDDQDDDDEDDKVSSQKPSTTVIISSNKAKELAFRHAGITASNAKNIKVDKNTDDDEIIYSVEFASGNTEYDYEINAITGKIVNVEKEVKKTEVEKTDDDDKEDDKEDDKDDVKEDEDDDEDDE